MINDCNSVTPLRTTSLRSKSITYKSRSCVLLVRLIRVSPTSETRLKVSFFVIITYFLELCYSWSSTLRKLACITFPRASERSSACRSESVIPWRITFSSSSQKREIFSSSSLLFSWWILDIDSRTLSRACFLKGNIFSSIVVIVFYLGVTSFFIWVSERYFFRLIIVNSISLP